MRILFSKHPIKVCLILGFTQVSACGLFYHPNVKKAMARQPVSCYTFSSYQPSMLDSTKDIFFLVFSDRDTAGYNLPLTVNLKIDSTRDDLSIYEVLARDFSVIKLYHNEFASMMNQPEKYPRFVDIDSADSNMSTDSLFSQLSADTSWYFISSCRRIWIYGAGSLTDANARDGIHGLIWVKFGP